MAEEAGLDLVEISPNAEPPVCKILDLGKLKYATQKKAAEARKKQKIIEIKEIKMRPNIDTHDYDVKMRAMNRFFEEGDKVKVTLKFRGREMAHQELGLKLLLQVKEDTAVHRQGRSRAEARGPPDDDGAGAEVSAAFSGSILMKAAGEAAFSYLMPAMRNYRGVCLNPIALFGRFGYKPPSERSGRACRGRSLRWRRPRQSISKSRKME